MNPYLDEFDKLDEFDVYGPRRAMVKKYAWAIPCDLSISKIAALSPIVEVGAGGGYWASLLQQAGATVRALDSGRLKTDAQWFPVEKGGPETLKEFGDGWSLFLCWPPYDDRMGVDCLRNFRGTRLAYVGEGSGGCTGDDDFHDYLDDHFNCVDVVYNPHWEGIHDSLRIYVKK